MEQQEHESGYTPNYRGREGGRNGGRAGGMEEGREEWRKGERNGGMEGGRNGRRQEDRLYMFTSIAEADSLRRAPMLSTNVKIQLSGGLPPVSLMYGKNGFS